MEKSQRKGLLSVQILESPGIMQEITCPLITDYTIISNTLAYRWGYTQSDAEYYPSLEILITVNERKA